MLNDERKTAIDTPSKIIKNKAAGPLSVGSMADGKMNGNGVNKNAMVAILNPNAAFLH